MTDLSPPPLHRPLGTSGLIVSSLAWGMWRFAGDDVAAAHARVEAALEAGITLLDTADIYGPDNGEPFGAAEALLGRVLAEAPALREKMVLATKGGIRMGVPYDSSPAALAEAIDDSLRRIGTERVELYQIHRPDLLTHPQEVARTLDDARQAGKIVAIGVSNHTPAQAAALARFLPVPLASHQPEFSALHLAPLFDGTFDQAIEHDMALLAWSPLGGGRLTRAGDTRGQKRWRRCSMPRRRRPASIGPRPPIAGSWRTRPGRSRSSAPRTPDRIRATADAYKPRWTRAEWYAVLQASMGESLP